uniref:Putative plasmid maintenance system antidote protein, XRE family n=1 Tax=Chlorobium chlorochromatii (strain CaD3) TaxID=340177 RepID=Q3ARX7_CHLCH
MMILMYLKNKGGARNSCLIFLTFHYAEAFGTSPEFWLNLQATYDLSLHKPTKHIQPLVAVSAQHEIQERSCIVGLFLLCVLG